MILHNGAVPTGELGRPPGPDAGGADNAPAATDLDAPDNRVDRKALRELLRELLRERPPAHSELAGGPSSPNLNYRLWWLDDPA